MEEKSAMQKEWLAFPDTCRTWLRTSTRKMATVPVTGTVTSRTTQLTARVHTHCKTFTFKFPRQQFHNSELHFTETFNLCSLPYDIPAFQLRSHIAFLYDFPLCIIHIFHSLAFLSSLSSLFSHCVSIYIFPPLCSPSSYHSFLSSFLYLHSVFLSPFNCLFLY